MTVEPTRVTGAPTDVAGTVPRGPTSGTAQHPLFEYCCRIGDDRLVLGHRLSQWCGHAPILEEDIALANFALDFIGQASAFLGLAGEAEGAGRDADALAFLRDEFHFRNAQLVELPIGDFAFTIVRQYLFDAFDVLFMARLASSRHPVMAGIAAKALKEATYHVRHSAAWVVRLGDGTDESRQRMQDAVDRLWAFAGELFEGDAVDATMMEQGIGVDLPALRAPWELAVRETMAQATLVVPADPRVVTGGRRGRHSEFLGHMLAEMQILPRSHPGASW
ncbi:MAG: phenylacetate-CoA oxygenase subunit PaaC [Gemmatimonadaceae bacterium]|nr:phenylacetate-CoA oxygenase subunit PaaC [Gemmatimonadaceae bacterium]